jgi:hypothetical protein
MCDPDPIVYQIRVRGVLDPQWSDWFDEMTVTPQADGETLLAGPVRDQCALHGILQKIRDLGLPLLSLSCTEAAPDHGPLLGGCGQ